MINDVVFVEYAILIYFLWEAFYVSISSFFNFLKVFCKSTIYEKYLNFWKKSNNRKN